MPKFSASARHASHPDGKRIKKSKHRGNQYRDAAKARKLRQTRIKGIVEEVVETVEPGKPRPLRRGPKYDFAKIERKIRASCEESQPVNTPTPAIPAEVYGANPVNFNVPRIIIPTSEATAKRKQAAAGDDDGDTTDVDDSEDAVVVPAGFVEAAEKLGLLSVPTGSSGLREGVGEPASASDGQPDEKPPAVEHLPTEIKTPSSPAVPHTTAPAPSPSSSTQPLYLVPEPVVVGAACNDSQTTAATSFPTYPESSEPSAPILVPQGVLVEAVYNDSQTTAVASFSTYLDSCEPGAPISVPQVISVPESFQEVAWSSASLHQNSTFWDNNMNDAQTFPFLQRDFQNIFYPGFTSDDVDMEVLGETTMEPLFCSTRWIAPAAPQQEQQTFWSSGSQVADENNYYQTHDNVYQNWAAMQSQQSGCFQQSIQINQSSFTDTVDPLTAASCFWTAFSGNSATYQSPASVQEPAPTRGDGPRPLEEPSNMIFNGTEISQTTSQNVQRYRTYDDRGLHPFSNLKGHKNMRPIDMIGELGESRIIRPMCRLKRPPDGSEDLISCLRMEAEGHAAPQMLQVKHRKRQREDSRPDFARTSNPDFEVPPRQRRRCKPDVLKLGTPLPAQKRRRKLHRRYEAPPTGPTSTREWTFSRFFPSIADRLFKFF